MALSIKALAPRPNGRLAPVGAVEFFFVAKEKEIKKILQSLYAGFVGLMRGGRENLGVYLINEKTLLFLKHCRKEVGLSVDGTKYRQPMSSGW